MIGSYRFYTYRLNTLLNQDGLLKMEAAAYMMLAFGFSLMAYGIAGYFK
jgi:hypothetical protein